MTTEEIIEEKDWEHVVGQTIKLKVEGGHIYCMTEGVCFVPDVDLTRYQSHLRDAYNQGWKDGQSEIKTNATEAYNQGFKEGRNDALALT